MDYFDVIHNLLPDIDLKFRIDKKGPTDIQVICGKEILPTLYTVILHTLKDAANTVRISALENMWCFDISFGCKDNAERFAKDYLSQRTKRTSKLAVIDNTSNKVLCAGFVRGMKHSDPVHRELMLISIDGTYYFHLNGNTKYHFEWYKGDHIIFTEPKDYKIIPWLESPKNDPSTVDVYKDHSYKELDPEVIPLVCAMNKIPGIFTTGSCCGHNNGPMYISFSVSSISAINLLRSCLKKEDSGCYGMFYIEIPTEYGTKYNAPSKKEFLLDGKHIIVNSILSVNNQEGMTQMTLLSKMKGDTVYKAAMILAELIQKELEVRE